MKGPHAKSPNPDFDQVLVSKKIKEEASVRKEILKKKKILVKISSLFLPNQEPLKCTACARWDGVGVTARHHTAFDDMCCTCVFDLRHP